MQTKSLGRVTGLSAYEVAKADGFLGSETQWLDFLKGPNKIEQDFNKP